jgi:hypothetical protein
MVKTTLVTAKPTAATIDAISIVRLRAALRFCAKRISRALARAASRCSLRVGFGVFGMKFLYHDWVTKQIS